MGLLAGIALALAALSGPGHDANVAPCQKAIRGSGPAGWRHRAVTAGPVGVFPRPLARMSRSPRGLTTKMPIGIDGQAPVTVSVPPRLRSRVFLYYGRLLDHQGNPTTSFNHADGYSETHFEPCPGRPRTFWPGGIRIRGRAPVHLSVQVEGRPEPFTLRLGRPKLLRVGENGTS